MALGLLGFQPQRHLIGITAADFFDTEKLFFLLKTSIYIYKHTIDYQEHKGLPNKTILKVVITTIVSLTFNHLPIIYPLALSVLITFKFRYILYWPFNTIVQEVFCSIKK